MGTFLDHPSDEYCERCGTHIGKDDSENWKYCEDCTTEIKRNRLKRG